MSKQPSPNEPTIPQSSDVPWWESVEWTDRERLFVDQYFVCNMNGTEAAAQSGYEGSREVLGVTAHRLLKNAKIRAAIQARLAEYRLSADEVLARLSLIAQGDVDDLMDEHGHIDIHKARRLGKTYLIKKYKVTRRTFGSDGEVETTEVELHDPQSALVNLGKYYKLFREQVDLNIDVAALSDDELRAIIEGRRK